MTDNYSEVQRLASESEVQRLTSDSEVRGYNEDFARREGRRRTARIITFGCKMNDNDSEKIMGLLVSMGYEIESAPTSGKFGNPAPLGLAGGIRLPDVVILNTCCVRENAERRFFGILGSLKRYKAEDPSRVLAVCGCMMQEANAVDKILKKYGYVDFIFGTKAISELPALLCGAYRRKAEQSIRECAGAKDGAGAGAGAGAGTAAGTGAGASARAGEVAVSNALDGKAPEDALPMHRKAPPHALISVMSGCDNFCSYCIVPYVRGREQSRTPASVIREAAGLAGLGYSEITLLGQNVNSYGKELPDGERCDFAELLRKISRIEGIRRIRFMTSHPKDLSDRLICAIRDLDAVCPHLHLPVQSGSTAVLKLMNRGYSREDYLKLIGKIKEAIPDITLTTDVIVGFPGEGDRDFDDTLQLADEVGFDMAYTFLFSPRAGTAAAGFSDQVPEAAAKERFDRLVKLQNDISYKKNLALVGKTVEVLCEGVSKTNGDRLTGRTPGGKVVNFTAAVDGAVGTYMDVRIEKARTWSLDGAILAT